MLGAVLLGNGRVLGPLVEFLQAGHFYWSAHKVIWHAMTELHNRGMDVDYITLTDQLGPRLAEVGGREAIDLLASCTPNWSHFLTYGQTVHRKAQWRRRRRAVHRLAEAIEAEDEMRYASAWEKAR